MAEPARRKATYADLVSGTRLNVAVSSAFLIVGLTLARSSQAYQSGHVFVTNRGGNNVLELDENLVYVKSWFDGAGLSVPNGMAFDPSDKMYVADTGNNRIVVFDATGAMVGSWSTLTSLAPQVESLNFDAAGRLFASANPGNGTVASWNADGTGMKTLVSDSAFISLGNVNFSMTGHVLLSDFSGTHGVRELDATSGAVLTEFGQGTPRHEDMVIEGNDNVFVSGFDASNVLEFDATRKLVGTFAPPGLKNPTGIVLTSSCKLLVASFNTAEIFELDYDGTFIKKVTAPGLSLPESLVIARLSLAGSVTLGSPVPKCEAVDGGSGGSGGADAAAGGGAAGGSGGGSGGANSGGGGTSGSAGNTAGGTGASSGSGATGGTMPHGGTAPSDDSGCGCRTEPARGNSLGWLGVIALFTLARRARATPASSSCSARRGRTRALR